MYVNPIKLEGTSKPQKQGKKTVLKLFSGGYPPNFIEEIPKVKGSDRYIYIYIYICTGILYKLTKFYRGPGAGFLKWSQYHSRTPGPHPQGLLRILLFHVICVLLSYYFLIMLLYMFTPCSCKFFCLIGFSCVLLFLLDLFWCHNLSYYLGVCYPHVVMSFCVFCSALLEPFVPVIQGLVVQYNAMSILFSCPITPLCYVLLLICFILAMKLEFCARAKPCSKDVRSCPSDVAITSFTIHQYQIYDLFCAA